MPETAPGNDQDGSISGKMVAQHQNRQMLEACIVEETLSTPGSMSACCHGYWEVNEGPVKEWNKAHPSSSVGPGAGFPVFLSLKEGTNPGLTTEDRILEVNGCRSGRL